MSLGLLLGPIVGRPNPAFQVGELVELTIKRGAPVPRQYLLVRERRWIKPEGCSEFEWVYDGPIYESVEHRIKHTTNAWCVREKSLSMTL